MKHSDKNLGVINNFILHTTHSGDHGLDAHFNEPMTFKPSDLYRIAGEYIKEDHVDGKDNPEDEIIKNSFSYESSFKFEDKEEAFPETLIIMVDKGYAGTETIGSFPVDQEENVKALVNLLNKI